MARTARRLFFAAQQSHRTPDQSGNGRLPQFAAPGLRNELFRRRPAPDQTRRSTSFAARTKSAKSGCGAKGFDFSSGWNWTPMNHG